MQTFDLIVKLTEFVIGMSIAVLVLDYVLSFRKG